MNIAHPLCKMPFRAGKQQGFMLLEVLISIALLAIGLLGLAGLQLKSQGTESDAYQRAQAILLAEDMGNMLSANRANAASYVTGGSVGTGDQEPASCSGLTGAQWDLCTWSNQLKGAPETMSGASVGAMTSARGCIELLSSNPSVYRITVAWQGSTQLNPPALTCGQNLYGNDGYRRAIATLVTIANLSAP